MNKIVKDQYTYYAYSPQEETDLMNSILKNIDLKNKDELFSVTDKVLNLPINEQIHFIHCVVDTMYELSGDSITNTNIEKFLAQKVFNIHRSVIDDVIDSDDINKTKNSENEKMLNIKIIDSGE